MNFAVLPGAIKPYQKNYFGSAHQHYRCWLPGTTITPSEDVWVPPELKVIKNNSMIILRGQNNIFWLTFPEFYPHFFFVTQLALFSYKHPPICFVGMTYDCMSFIFIMYISHVGFLLNVIASFGNCCSLFNQTCFNYMVTCHLHTIHFICSTQIQHTFLHMWTHVTLASILLLSHLYSSLSPSYIS